MPGEPPTLFRFADLTLDLARGRLLRGAEDVALRPKSFALLVHMACNAGRVVSKDELLDALWPDVTVTEDSLTQCVHEVRRALGPEGPALLRTVPRRGYLFAAAVPGPAAVMPHGTGTAAAEAPADATGPRLRHDGIAVLPFTLASTTDRADALLLDGLAHDVISRLARLRGFHVIARGSTFALRHLAGDPQAAGRALNVAYVVTGTATVLAARVHLRIEIVEAAGGGILWTGDFAEARAAFTGLIGGLTDRIVHSVHMQITAAEARRAAALPDESLDAWENYHAGIPDLYCPDPERIARALERFQTATRLSPGFARAYAALSSGHYVLALTGMTADLAADVAAARRAAEAALQADDGDPLSHWAFGRVRWLEGDPEGSLQHLRQAIALSPGFALAHFEIGFVEAVRGDPRRGVAQLDLGLSLSPYDPILATVRTSRAFALYRLGEIEEAAHWARDAVRQRNTYATILAPSALILASAGHIGEAREIAARLRETAPDLGGEHLQRSLDRLSGDLGALLRKHRAQIGL